MRAPLACLTLVALATLAGCATRPLTGNERAFAETVTGDAVRLDDVRIVKGSASALVPTTIPPRPRTTCRARLSPPRDRPVPGVFAAFVLGERIHYARAYWEADFARGYPQELDLREAMRLAHELTHVWQWQRRDVTGYGPLRVAGEHVAQDDPYLTDLAPDRGFLDYGWEQQGILVEEFVCCRALDPEAPRTKALLRLVRQPFPEAAARARVSPEAVRLPWRGAETRGICR